MLSNLYIRQLELHIPHKLLVEDTILGHESKTKLLEYHNFIKSGVHILAEDSTALLQLALNLPNTSSIYIEAGMLFLLALGV